MLIAVRSVVVTVHPEQVDGRVLVTLLILGFFSTLFPPALPLCLFLVVLMLPYLAVETCHKHPGTMIVTGLVQVVVLLVWPWYSNVAKWAGWLAGFVATAYFLLLV